jgi:hypothetical protein
MLRGQAEESQSKMRNQRASAQFKRSLRAGFTALRCAGLSASEPDRRMRPRRRDAVVSRGHQTAARSRAGALGPDERAWTRRPRLDCDGSDCGITSALAA